MKTALVCAIASLLSSVGWSQPIPVSELVGANNVIRDQLYGISVTHPAGWQVRGAQRWGKNNQENTIAFMPIWPLASRPSLYYQPKSNFNTPAPEPGQEEAHFRLTAGTKAASRVASGLRDYKNLEDTFDFTKLNGRPAVRYVASFTLNGKKQYEYFIRVLGDRMMVMFFTQGPAEELEVVREEIDKMSASVVVP